MNGSTCLKQLCSIFLLFVFVSATPHANVSTDSKNIFELSTMSTNRHFLLTLKTEDGKAPQINTFHNWIVTLTDYQGAPVYPAYFSLSGGMPAHGHGLPTQPMITRHLGKGNYLIEGVKFNMYGEWQLKFHITANKTEDKVIADFAITY